MGFRIYSDRHWGWMLALSALGLSSLTGCSGIRLVVQAARGQLELSNRARPLDEVIKNERTPARIRTLLSEVPKVKAFGERHGLKPTGNYVEYVALDRPAAIWVVSASRPLKFESREWGFPIIGKFPFLGWFDRKDADEYAQSLREEGWDVDVRGAGAYSTLGWFRDAVLSTMIPDGQEAMGELANVVIHESTHATLYIKGQSNFNERLAVFVADRLTDIYLIQGPGVDSEQRRAYFEAERESIDRRKLFYEAYQALEALYGSSKSDAEKLREKARIIDELKSHAKIKREVNNATLVQFKTYHVEKDEFGNLYQACSEDMNRFLKALARLTPESFSSSQQEDFRPVLAPLIKESCR